MRPRGRNWRIVVGAALMAGAAWTTTLAAEEWHGRCRASTRAAPFDDQALSCAPLTSWTVRLAAMELAQYPPGYGEPSTY